MTEDPRVIEKQKMATSYCEPMESKMQLLYGRTNNQRCVMLCAAHGFHSMEARAYAQ